MLNALLAAVAIVAGPPQSAALAGRMEVDEHEPIVIRSDIEIDDGWSVLYDWSIDKPARIREVDSGRSVHAWAPPGEYEVELSAIFARQAETGGAIEFRKETSVTILFVRESSKPDPPRPPPGPKPVPTIGRTETVLILRSAEDSTAENLALVEIRQAATFEGKTPKLLILDLEQKTANDEPDPIVAKYRKQTPDGAGFPYFFAIDGNGEVVASGEVGEAKDFLSKIEGLLR